MFEFSLKQTNKHIFVLFFIFLILNNNVNNILEEEQKLTYFGGGVTKTLSFLNIINI